MFAPVTLALVEDGLIGSGNTVLDIATGPGEPALTIAALGLRTNSTNVPSGNARKSIGTCAMSFDSFDSLPERLVLCPFLGALLPE